MGLVGLVDDFQSLLARARAHRERYAAATFRSATSHIPAAAAFDGLHPRSLAVASIRPAALAPALNLVLPQVSLASMFAGSRTALEFGFRLADLLGLPVRIIGLTGRISLSARKSILNYVGREFAPLAPRVVAVLESRELPSARIGQADYWIATHWTTAHAMDVASRLGLVDPAAVIYLIQDYEPGFNPWSTEFALARATYHSGFRSVVNSRPLSKYLLQTEGLSVSEDLVFRPQLDRRRLEQSWRRREARVSGVPSVLFYARPDKPRNLFGIGMSTLALTILKESKEGRCISIRTAGSAHDIPETGPLRNLHVLGKTSWDDYFHVLADSDVVLSLQHSPHPSHPPLDAIVSGGWAVTNELDGTRGQLHPRLIARDADPERLSEGLRECLTRVRMGDRCSAFSPSAIDALGDDLGRVAERLAARLVR